MTDYFQEEVGEQLLILLSMYGVPKHKIKQEAQSCIANGGISREAIARVKDRYGLGGSNHVPSRDLFPAVSSPAEIEPEWVELVIEALVDCGCPPEDISRAIVEAHNGPRIDLVQEIEDIAAHYKSCASGRGPSSTSNPRTPPPIPRPSSPPALLPRKAIRRHWARAGSSLGASGGGIRDNQRLEPGGQSSRTTLLHTPNLHLGSPSKVDRNRHETR